MVHHFMYSTSVVMQRERERERWHECKLQREGERDMVGGIDVTSVWNVREREVY